jgi:type II secretory pathway predicted ATPase ExeA
MSQRTVSFSNKRRLQAHYGFTGMPFRKSVKASTMFDSSSQRQFIQGLHLWPEVGGLGLGIGPTGVGKSIAVRRFLLDLEESRFWVLRFTQVPSTPIGFLRSLTRLLDLPMRRHATDLFDQARERLNTHADSHGPRPMLILDDAENTPPETLDILRRLTNWELDAGDHFAVLVVGTEDLLLTLRHPLLEPLRSRFLYVHHLRPFTLEDTRNYVRFHLTASGGSDELLTDGAVQEVFQASRGAPRLINQLVLHAMIGGVLHGVDRLDQPFLKRAVATHPLFSRGES